MSEAKARWARELTAAPFFAEVVREIDQRYWTEWKATTGVDRREAIHGEMEAFARLCAYLKEVASGRG